MSTTARTLSRLVEEQEAQIASTATVLPFARVVDVMERCEPSGAPAATDAEWDAALADAKLAVPCANRLTLSALALAEFWLSPGSAIPTSRMLQHVGSVSRAVCEMFGIDPKADDARYRLLDLAAQVAAVENAKILSAAE